ncbi:hypothetical protein H0H92_006187 [Tricholoma furcatifolium]|nr:hypothetical protein H0H92_006187 [Tricholoma furcatifolium]
MTNVILITGAAGWLGGLLARALTDDVNNTPNSDLHLILADIIEPRGPGDVDCVTIKADLTNESEVEALFHTRLGIPSTVYCLHGIMSRGAEENFDFGLKPEMVSPTTIATPEGAYGLAKLTSELFINEYTRRGFIDGRILRLPTIVVRPGPPAPATSAFISSIIREPLEGRYATCPIGDSIDSPALNLPSWLVTRPQTTV